jgi:hypothetical protein
VRSFIYQLAEQSHTDMKPQVIDLEDALDSSDWHSGDYGISFGRMTQLMVQLLATSDKSLVITVVIDRLDQCNWVSDQYEEAEALHVAVGALTELVNDPALNHLRVTILLVMEEGRARHTTKRYRSWKGRRLEWKTDWHQEAMDDVEE